MKYEGLREKSKLKLTDVPKGVKDLIVNYIEKYRKL